MNKYNESMVQLVFITRFLINIHDRTRKTTLEIITATVGLQTLHKTPFSMFSTVKIDVKFLDFPRISTGYMPMDFAKFSKKVANRIYAEWDI